MIFLENAFKIDFYEGNLGYVMIDDIYNIPQLLEGEYSIFMHIKNPTLRDYGTEVPIFTACHKSYLNTTPGDIHRLDLTLPFAKNIQIKIFTAKDKICQSYILYESKKNFYIKLYLDEISSICYKFEIYLKEN